jgi:hypothetical protein
MNFSDLLKETLDTNKIPGRIGYGIRNAKTHELIKFFPNLHFYQDLKKFREDKSNLEALEKSIWKITNEKEFQGKRSFTFWGKEDEEFPVKKDETYPLDNVKLGKVPS